MTLPADIEQIFYNTLCGDKTILEFEEWVYAGKPTLTDPIRPWQ